MARASGSLLDTGDTFPTLEFETVTHGRIALPDAFRGGWGVFLAYRAHW